MHVTQWVGYKQRRKLGGAGVHMSYCTNTQPKAAQHNTVLPCWPLSGFIRAACLCLTKQHMEIGH